MKTVELYSLADKYATNRTIANAIGWNPFDLSLGQIDYLWNKEKVKMTDQYRSKQIIRKIKEQDIHFKIKRIFFIGIPSSDRMPQDERSYYDSGMHFLRFFERNGISYELVQSEGMTEDLDILQRNSQPLYDRVVKHLAEKTEHGTFGPAGLGSWIDADQLAPEIRRQIHLEKMNFASLGGGQQTVIINAYEKILDLIDAHRQDKKSVELELCSQAWWEERGWMMIPPDITVEGVDSILKQVRKKLSQDHQEEELTTFEEKVKELIRTYPVATRENRGNLIYEVREIASELLSLAREQFIKDGYVIEKKIFHDAMEKVDPEVKKEVSENMDMILMVK